MHENLSLLLLNIRSLSCNFLAFESQLATLIRPPTIIALTETWLNNDSSGTAFKLLGYQPIIESHRKSGRKGGGVALYIKEGIKYCVVTPITDIEILIVGIIPSGMEKLYLLVNYCSPSANKKVFLSKLEDELDNLPVLAKKIACGDFNIDTMKKGNEVTKQFLSMFNQMNLKALNLTKPTRVTKTSATCIDHVFASINGKTHIHEWSISDHYCLFTTFEKRMVKNYPIMKVRDSKNLNNPMSIEKMNLMVSVKFAKFSSHLSCPSEKFSVLISCLTEVLDIFCPIKTIKFKEQYGWINSSIKRMISKRDKLFAQSRNDSAKIEEFQKMKAKVRNEIRKSKKSYLNGLVHKGANLFDVYKKIADIKPVKTSISNLTDVNRINAHFSQVGEVISKLTAPEKFDPSSINRVLQSMYYLPCTPSEVTKIIHSLKNKTSLDAYGLSNKICKLLSPSLEVELSNLINECVFSGVFPDCLKVARVTPIFKSGDENSCDNYRPISIISPIAKIFEKVLQKRVVSYFDKFNLWYESQFGFRKKHGTIDAIIEMLETLGKVSTKHNSEAAYIDLSKAFDSVNHNILLKKLESYGIRGFLLNLFKSYLGNRMQFVEINGRISDKLPIKTGVPQGSIMGPVLFLIHINDMHLSTQNSKLILFADDASLISRHNTVDFVEDVNNLMKWCSHNSLAVNMQKSCVLKFENRKLNEIPLEYNLLQFNPDSIQKYLGIYIDKKLTFRTHVDYVLQKVSKLGGMIKQMRKVLIRDHLWLFYNAYIKSTLQYGILIYGNVHFTVLDGLFSQQKKILRSILARGKYDSITHCFHEYNVLTVYELYVYELLKHVVKIRLKRYNTATMNSMLDRGCEKVSNIRTRTDIKGTLSERSCSNIRNTTLRIRTRRFYNILIESNLLNESLCTMSEHQLKNFLHTFRDTLISGNIDLIRKIFEG